VVRFSLRLLTPAALALGLAASGPARAQDGACALPGTTSVKLPLKGIAFGFGEPVLVDSTLHAVGPVAPPAQILPDAVLHANPAERLAVGLFSGTRYLATGPDSDIAIPADPRAPTFRVSARLFDPSSPLIPVDPCRVTIGTMLNDFGMRQASQADAVGLSDPGAGFDSGLARAL
jgi:hypothetical protein